MFLKPNSPKRGKPKLEYTLSMKKITETSSTEKAWALTY